MPSNNKSDFILLSKLIHKLEDNSYYRTFAKTLARSTNTTDSLPPDNELVKEMFHFFIREDELQIYYNGSVVSADFIENIEVSKPLERIHIWENEIYIKVQDLKKLYANKCIVFSKSLLTDRDNSK